MNIRERYEALKSRMPEGVSPDKSDDNIYMLDKLLNHRIPDMLDDMETEENIKYRELLVNTISILLNEAEKYLEKFEL